jgi:hypothetical protein
MELAELDSRTGLGTDRVARRTFSDWQEPGASSYVVSGVLRSVRVITGHVGDVVRFSAPELGVIADGRDASEAWRGFIETVNDRFEAERRAWFAYDVGPTRPEEVAAALGAPEDEYWDNLLGADE